jgi:hypothetical protein
VKFQGQIVAVEPGAKNNATDWQAEVLANETIEVATETEARTYLAVQASAMQISRRKLGHGSGKQIVRYVFDGEVKEE